MFVGGAGWGFIPCFSLILSPSSCTLRAFGVSWFLWCGSCLFACVCMRGPFRALRRNFNILGFHTYAHVVGMVRGVWALNILVCHTIVSPWFVAIPYSESVCMLCGWRGGWGFIPCFPLTLSSSSFTLRPCVRLCMRAWSVPLAPSFAFLTYLFAIPLFPHAPWPSHTVCLFFSVVMYLAVLGAYGGMGIYGCGSCLYACFMTCVVVRCSFLCAVLSLWRPPLQHTWFPHLRMCSGGNVGCMGS